VLTRRQVLSGVSLLAACAVLGVPRVSFAQWADTVPASDLAVPSPLGDMTLGKDDAPVTVIEYASMTCPHCAHFATTTFPAFRQKYIDTGKVRYIFREFPLDNVALGAAVVARSADKSKFFPIIELLFSTQAQWITQTPVESMAAVLKQAGISADQVKSWLDLQKNEASRTIVAGIKATQDFATDKLGVKSTPTFFINGKRVPGALSLDEMDRELSRYLKV